jgi:hypothetical protein
MPASPEVAHGRSIVTFVNATFVWPARSAMRGTSTKSRVIAQHDDALRDTAPQVRGAPACHSAI